jgi:hypothetical protein
MPDLSCESEESSVLRQDYGGTVGALHEKRVPDPFVTISV